MSHFTVLVVGENYEQQLAPYHEFECTGEDDRYVQDIDVTADTLADYEKHGESKPIAQFIEDWSGHKPVLEGTAPDLAGEHKYGYVVVNADGGLVKDIDRTNPNRKWDWYSVGGRWHGFFKMKNGAKGELGEPSFMNAPRDLSKRADSASKKDIDVDGMRNEAAEKAGKRYDKFMKATADCPPIIPWPAVRAKYPDNVDKAREEYHNQPGIQAKNADEDLMWEDAEDYLVSRGEYVERARRGAFCTFAVVKDGQWYERGHMGWWAIVSDEKEDGVWEREFSELIDSLSPNTLLTVVDCHI
jgi:hypothetical protein